MNGNGTTGTPVANVVRATQAWIHAPFASPVSLYDLFLITGAVIIFAWLWSRVLVHIGE